MFKYRWRNRHFSGSVANTFSSKVSRRWLTERFSFPANFLWGTATAAHQVEGNNVNSDFWVLEHTPGSPFVEPSGDACDQYHRYADDIAMLARLGFNVYRSLHRMGAGRARARPVLARRTRSLPPRARMLSRAQGNAGRNLSSFHLAAMGRRRRRMGRQKDRRPLRAILRARGRASRRPDRRRLHHQRGQPRRLPVSPRHAAAEAGPVRTAMARGGGAAHRRRP